MKFIATNMKVTEYLTGGVGIHFDTSEQTKSQLSELKDGTFNITIVPYKKERSKNQNALLWELIGQICEAENGSKAETEEIYLQLLEDTGARVDFLQGVPQSINTLKQFFRIVKIVDERIVNGTKTQVFKCFTGSSNFNTSEMNKLIDKTIERAEWDGLNVESWKEELKG